MTRDTKYDTEFLEQSNAIERVYDSNSLEQAKLAWNFALGLDKIEYEELMHIHALIMINLNLRIAGQIRKVNVRVGDYACPNPGSVRRMLFQFLPTLNSPLRNMIDGIKEDVCKALHVRFENIHPFEDGNGRVGRILYNWQRVKSNLPIHVIHEGAEQQEYYNWFREARK